MMAQDYWRDPHATIAAQFFEHRPPVRCQDSIETKIMLRFPARLEWNKPFRKTKLQIASRAKATIFGNWGLDCRPYKGGAFSNLRKRLPAFGPSAIAAPIKSATIRDFGTHEPINDTALLQRFTVAMPRVFPNQVDRIRREFITNRHIMAEFLQTSFYPLDHVDE